MIRFYMFICDVLHLPDRSGPARDRSGDSIYKTGYLCLIISKLTAIQYSLMFMERKMFRINKGFCKSLSVVFVAVTVLTVSCKKEQSVVQQPVPEVKSAIVTFVLGDVKVSSQAEAARDLCVNDRIKPGSIIETGDKSIATLQINEVGSILINEKTMLIIDSILTPEKGTALDLKSGSVFSRIVKKTGNQYSVKTMTMLAAVRGTEFLTIADRDKWHVLVKAGTVNVSTDIDPEGKPVIEKKKADVDKKGSIKIGFQNRIQELTLEKLAVKSPYIEEVEKKTAEDIKDVFKKLEPEEKKIEQKIEKLKEMMLSPLDRLRKQGRPLVELFLKDGIQIIGAIEKTGDGKLKLNTGESIIDIPKDDIRRRIPVK